MLACPVPPPATPAADRPRYELIVRVRSHLREVRGHLAVRFTPNRSTDRLVFRLWANGPPQRREGSRLQVGPATADGKTLQAAHPDPTTLVLRLGRTLSAGSAVSVALPWRLRVPADAVDRNSRFFGGVRLGSFFPVLAWDPRRGWVTDPPARVLGESSTTPVADFDVHVTAPRGFRSLVSGSPVGPGHWRAHAVRDVGLAVARFRIVTGKAHAPRLVTVRVGAAVGVQQSPRLVLRLAIRALERLARRYGPYPWASYTVVVPPDLGAVGIEYPTLVYVGEGLQPKVVVDHETAHQWFYSLVGNDQARDPWLDEALATWAQLQLRGGVTAALDTAPPGTPRHVGAPMSYWRSLRRYFTEVYGGGVRALASLGPPRRVDCALRLYVARNAYRIAQPGDLLDALDRVFQGAEHRLRRFGISR
jgi:hypothetical protein